MMQPARFIAAHFAAYRKRNKWPFFWRILVEGLLVPSALLVAIQAVFTLHSKSVLGATNSVPLFIGAVILVPAIETVLLQALPVMVARHFNAGFWVQVFASMALMVAVRFPFGVETGILAGAVSGFYLAFTYAHWQDESFNSALGMTAGVHAVHNLVVCLFAMV